MTPKPRGTFSYLFTPVTSCNMCGGAPPDFEVLGRRLNTHQGLWPRTKRGLAVSVVRCRDCGLVFPDPLPQPERMEDHYDVAPESYWNEDYFQVKPDYFAGQIAIAKTLLGEVDDPRARAVGAGSGKGLVARERGGFQSFGFEPSPAFRNFGLSRFGFDADRFRLGSLEEAEYPEGSFHFVNFGAVLEHLSDPSGSLRKALQWLVPGGVFYVEVPSSRWLMARMLRVLYRLTGTDYVTNLSPMHPPFHLYEFETRTFRVHARDHGYDLVRVDHYVGDPFVPRFLRPIMRSMMRATGTGMQLAVWGRKSQ